MTFKDEGIPEFMANALLRNANNLISDLNHVVIQLQQYSISTCLVIPKKYEKRVINELELFNEEFNTPVAYNIEDTPDSENVLLTLINFGVIQKESLIKTMRG